MIGKWQPIETAPKDGTPVLLYAKYSNGPPDMITARYKQWGREPDNYCDWQLIQCGSFADDSVASGEKTHWMPLPPEPETSEQSEAPL